MSSNSMSQSEHSGRSVGWRWGGVECYSSSALTSPTRCSSCCGIMGQGQMVVSGLTSGTRLCPVPGMEQARHSLASPAGVENVGGSNGSSDLTC